MIQFINGNQVKFPSGIVYTLKKMSGNSQNKLADRKLVQQGTVFDEIIVECIEEVKSIEEIKDWLIGDKFFAIVAIRILTFGSKFEFRGQCPYCEQTHPYWIDLTSLEVRYLEGKLTTDLGFTLPGEQKKIVFHLLRGKEEPLMKEISKRKPDKLVTSLLALRTDAIEGEQMVDESFFENLGADDIMEYRDFVDECDCGIDTTMELDCPNCSAEFEMELPIDENFFFPKRKKKK